ncbi:MAG TPA: NAD(P)-dependent alcohol dehydrogenase [Pseudolysinimonas sp.]|jgi:uncharacterized zinc-type alcohol dehydrogenase-like protein
MRSTSALVITESGGRPERATIERRDPAEHDVAIRIDYSGVCHSDIHQARNEWDGDSIYPMVPGHEIVGTVTGIGSAVTRHAVGDRVGVGVYVDSCRVCDHCRRGLPQYCLAGFVPTYNGRDYEGNPTLGGYCRDIVVDEAYVLAIPAALDPAAAAPLLCAGITVYSPLKHWGAGPGVRVAVIGMGGLGHLAVKLAHALGAHVTVLSHSLAKMDDGLAFGADEYFATGEPSTFARLERSFDLILNTVAVNLDIPAYLGLLDLDGTLVHVGIPSEPDAIKMATLGDQRRSVAASMIGSLDELQEMLHLCAEKGIAAEVELITADEVPSAWERVVDSAVRYRFVIDALTI